MNSWRRNLQQKGGFWNHGRWYDLHIGRRMPLVGPMMEELLTALPPLDAESAVCDLGAGTGNASLSLLMAYPTVHLTLIDQDPDLLALAVEKLSEFREEVGVFEATVLPDGEPLPGAPYDLVVASLALHAVVGDDPDTVGAESRYELLFQGIRGSLKPGGHVIIADHVGTLSLFRQMKALERAGFNDIDCAWRQDDFFVCGARTPA